MGVLKSDVLDFVSKLKREAVQAVEDKYRPLIEEKEQQAINKDEAISIALKGAKLKLAEAEELIRTIKVRAQEIGLEEVYAYTDLNSQIRKVKDIRETLDAVFINQYKIEDADIVRKERDEKRSEVKEAYTEIYTKISRMSSKKNMLEYLRGLGFNIEELEQPKKVDFSKSTLFPCVYLDVKEERLKNLVAEFLEKGYSQNAIEELKTKNDANDIDGYIDNLQTEKSYWGRETEVEEESK